MMIPNVTTTRCDAQGAAADGERERLAQILDEYLLGLERGEPVEPAELIARHPDVADRLRGYLSGLALFHRAAAPPALPALAITGGPELGAVLGDFRLIREIGRGGMGVVYEAMQLSLGRRVAVKLLPFSGPINEKQIARFKHEAQAAAQIDHPHIVPVFAIGQEQAIHYFAMQLIGGQSLAELVAGMREETNVDNADAKASVGSSRSAETLDHVMAVARMGVQAAEALDAAHEIGVVHRDIKPSNLLLDEKGKVWVTDFGVARCKASDSLTETGYVVGSMPYMSPEQSLGQSALVDHRSDIYSLGITLYELATLRHPCEGSAHAETAIEFSRAQWRPVRTWNHAIPVDFENIVLKAMAESRDERYATAGELADDLRRFLNGEPILARPPSLSTRVEKWTRRHQRAVAVAIATLAIALIGVVASLFMITSERAKKDAALASATQNRIRAEKKLTAAREVLDRSSARVNELLANNVPGAEGVRRKLLAEMLPYYREFAREAVNDPSLQADLAMTYSKIGHLTDQIGSQSDAEEAYREAQKILQQLAKRNPTHLEHQRNLALCSNNLGQVLQKRGELVAAKAELQTALAIQQKLGTAKELSAEIQPELATTYGNLGLLFASSGDKVRAAEHHQAAIKIQETLRQTSPNDEANLHQLAGSYNNLSALYPAQPEIAQRCVEQALALQLMLVRLHPTRRDYQSDLALNYNNLGALHARQSRLPEAEICYRDAITIQLRLVSVSPLVTSYQRDLVASLSNLGLTQTRQRSFTDAEKSFAQALEMQQDLVTADPQNLNQLSVLGGIHNNRGMLQQQQEDWEAAGESFEQAIEIQKQAFERAPTVARYRESLSKHYFNYAVVLRTLDRPADAAAVTLARRDLWPNDGQRLQKIAGELAELSSLIPAGERREEFVHEVAQTRSAATKAGFGRKTNKKLPPFEVRFDDAATIQTIAE
jgi:hypothetical protein